MFRSVKYLTANPSFSNVIVKRHFRITGVLGTQLTSSKHDEVCPAQLAQNLKKDLFDNHIDKEAWNNAKPYDQIPGPKPLPILGNTWRFLPKIGDYGDIMKERKIGVFLNKLREDYGDIIRLNKILGRKDALHLFNPEDIEMVYKIEGVLPERDILPSMSHFRKIHHPELFEHAKGLLTSQGDEWYQFRNKVNTIMMQPKVVRQYLEPVDNIANEFVEKIKRIRGPDNKINLDILAEINKWSLESIAFIALNTKLNCMADNLPENSRPAKMVKIAEDTFTMGLKLDFEPSIWKLVSTPVYRQAMKIYSEQVEMGKMFIEEAMKKIEEDKKNGVSTNADSEPSVLEKLLEIDPKVAIVMALDMLLAGIDTTSTALVNILYYLAANPSKQDKLRSEILSLLPSRSDKLTMEKLNSMQYLRACNKEAGRLYPVTPGTMRILTKDIVLKGYQVPKGTEVLFPHMCISVDEKNYKRAKEFIPERWLRNEVDSELSYKNAHPFCTMQFGFGSRSCIGRRFAELELEVAVINFMRNFKLSWEGPPPVQTTTSINYLLGPFNFTFNNLDSQ